MNDPYELKAAVLAAKENTSLPVIATMIFDSKGRLLTGGDIPAAVALLEGLRVDALGVNCGMGPEQMKGLLTDLLACSSLPVVMNPVSYTHLDVYKRQLHIRVFRCCMVRGGGLGARAQSPTAF